MVKWYLRFVDWLFLLLISSLIFTLIPHPISLEILGTTGKEFAVYPLMLGMLLTAYIWFISKGKNIFGWSKGSDCQTFFTRAKWYFWILFAVLAFSAILGALNYPYTDQFLYNKSFLPVRLVKVMKIFSSEHLSEGTIILWLVFRGIKNVFFDVFWLFGGSFLIFWWYCERSARCLELLIKGIFVSIGIVFLYEIIELPYLLGSQTASSILTIVNPYIHQIGYLNNQYIGNSDDAVRAFAWWPPLLLKHQVRSVFPEPSFMGMYCAFVVPWLWFVWLQIKKDDLLSVKGVTLSIVMLVLYFLLFATQARTAILLLTGELVLLLIYGIYRKNKGDFAKIIAILLLVSMGLGGSLIFTQVEKDRFALLNGDIDGNYINENGGESLFSKAGKSYISENIASAVGKDKRSNRARFSLMEAELKVWMAHPVLGVGKGLKAAYIPDKLPSDATQSSEVKMWLDRLHANGALKASFPDVSEYTSKLCEIGLLGCLLYYFPAAYLAYFFLLFLRRSRENKQYLRIQSLLSFYLISLAGILAGGISTSLNVNYCFGVLLGIGFILHHQVKKLEVTKN